VEDFLLSNFPVLLEINTIWEMSAEWAESGEEKIAEIVWRNVRCLDTGFENEGVGGGIYNPFRKESMSRIEFMVTESGI
jgi:hypothetical protein